MHQVEQTLDRLINYTASMSLDPEVVSQAISGVGKGIGHILTSAGEGTVNELLKGPLQILINLFVICALVIGVLFMLWKLRHTRCTKKVKNRFSGKKNLTTADRTVQKQEDSHKEIELVEKPTKELVGYQSQSAKSKATHYAFIEA